MSSQDKLVIVDSEKVLIRPIIALPLSASMLSCLFAYMLKAREKKCQDVTNGNGFCQEKFHLCRQEKKNQSKNGI